MKELLEKLKDDFVGLADEEFPKGVSRERGQAMVLIAMCLIKAEAAIEAYIAEQRREAVDEYVENVARHARGERLDHLSKKGTE